jgi:hypothetical protein
MTESSQIESKDDITFDDIKNKCTDEIDNRIGLNSSDILWYLQNTTYTLSLLNFIIIFICFSNANIQPISIVDVKMSNSSQIEAKPIIILMIILRICII